MGHEQVISAIHKKGPANCSRLPRLVASKGSAAEAPNAWWLRGEKMLERTLALATVQRPSREKAACGVAGSLQPAGLIHYRRGAINVLDRLAGGGRV
jgi:hypothetical protein